MLLNEKLEEYFTNKEIQKLRSMELSGMRYNSMINDFSDSKSNTLTVTIRDEYTNTIEGSLSGIVDFTNSQFIVKQISIDSTKSVTETIERLTKQMITNLEINHPEIELIFWRVNKNYVDCIRACYNCGFEMEESNNYCMEFSYHLRSSSIRRTFNASKVISMLD